MEAVKILEAQPRGTPRRMGRGTYRWWRRELGRPSPARWPAVAHGGRVRQARRGRPAGTQAEHRYRATEHADRAAGGLVDAVPAVQRWRGTAGLGADPPGTAADRGIAGHNIAPGRHRAARRDGRTDGCGVRAGDRGDGEVRAELAGMPFPADLVPRLAELAAALDGGEIV